MRQNSAAGNTILSRLINKSVQCANRRGRRSVCFCRQVETPVFVCLCSNC